MKIRVKEASTLCQKRMTLIVKFKLKGWRKRVNSHSPRTLAINTATNEEHGKKLQGQERIIQGLGYGLQSRL